MYQILNDKREKQLLIPTSLESAIVFFRALQATGRSFKIVKMPKA